MTSKQISHRVCPNLDFTTIELHISNIYKDISIQVHDVDLQGFGAYIETETDEVVAPSPTDPHASPSPNTLRPTSRKVSYANSFFRKGSSSFSSTLFSSHRRQLHKSDPRGLPTNTSEGSPFSGFISPTLSRKQGGSSLAPELRHTRHLSASRPRKSANSSIFSDHIDRRRHSSSNTNEPSHLTYFGQNGVPSFQECYRINVHAVCLLAGIKILMGAGWSSVHSVARRGLLLHCTITACHLGYSN